MADARLPERYLADRRILRLTDAERSSLFMATTWSVSNRTDGRIEQDDLALIPTFHPKVIPTLVKAGLWEADGPIAWVIVDYERDQTSRTQFEVLENVRRREREKKQRQRAKPADAVPGDSPGGQHRQGKSKARQVQEPGQENGEASGLNKATGEIVGWPTAVPGDPDVWTSPDAPGRVIGKGAA